MHRHEIYIYSALHEVVPLRSITHSTSWLTYARFWPFSSAHRWIVINMREALISRIYTSKFIESLSHRSSDCSIFKQQIWDRNFCVIALMLVWSCLSSKMSYKKSPSRLFPNTSIHKSSSYPDFHFTFEYLIPSLPLDLPTQT
jgi:hypothetical protein